MNIVPRLFASFPPTVVWPAGLLVLALLVPSGAWAEIDQSTTTTLSPPATRGFAWNKGRRGAGGIPAHSILLKDLSTGQTLYEYQAQRRGPPASLTKIKEEIAELEEAKAISDEARRCAEAANVAKSRFLATMSHELRTPLNAILGFSEVMKSEIMGPMHNPQYKDYAGNIHHSGTHLLNLINEILDLSRIEAGRYELHEEPLRLIDVLEDCERLLRLRAESKGLHFIEQFDDALPQIWADERAVRQICLNLMSNALKFTPRGGQITLTVAGLPDGGQLISVRDTGPGIPKDEIPKVLQAFGQGSLAHQTAEGGTGLGLPIVQNLVELHGGVFELRSELRKGTDAMVIFPKKRVLAAVPPLQPRGQEKHKTGAAPTSPRPPRLRSLRGYHGTQAG